MLWELLGRTLSSVQVSQGWRGQEGRVFSVAAASRTHKFSHLKCILTGSSLFSVTSSHMEGWGTPLDGPKGHPRAVGRAGFGKGVGWDG